MTQPMTAPATDTISTWKSNWFLISLGSLLILLIIVSVSLVVFYRLQKELCCVSHCSTKHKAYCYYCCYYHKCFHFISWCLLLSSFGRLVVVHAARFEIWFRLLVPLLVPQRTADSCVVPRRTPSQNHTTLWVRCLPIPCWRVFICASRKNKHLAEPIEVFHLCCANV